MGIIAFHADPPLYFLILHYDICHFFKPGVTLELLGNLHQIQPLRVPIGLSSGVTNKSLLVQLLSYLHHFERLHLELPGAMFKKGRGVQR